MFKSQKQINDERRKQREERIARVKAKSERELWRRTSSCTGDRSKKIIKQAEGTDTDDQT